MCVPSLINRLHVWTLRVLPERVDQGNLRVYGAKPAQRLLTLLQQILQRGSVFGLGPARVRYLPAMSAGHLVVLGKSKPRERTKRQRLLLNPLTGVGEMAQNQEVSFRKARREENSALALRSARPKYLSNGHDPVMVPTDREGGLEVDQRRSATNAWQTEFPRTTRHP